MAEPWNFEGPKSGNALTDCALGNSNVIAMCMVSSVEYPKSPVHSNPDYYRERAAEMLKRADEMETEEARSTFLDLAAGWDRMAQLVERSH